MSSFNTFADRNRDAQDGIERHAFDEMEAVEGGGHIVKVKGTGTQDEEAFYLSVGGIGIRPKKGMDIEVHLLSAGSDTSLKFAIVAIPHDKEHKWKEGQNGLQKYDDPDRRIQWGENKIHLTDKGIALGPNGELELIGGKIYIRGDLIVGGQVKATGDVHTGGLIRHNGMGAPAVSSPPGFEAE